MERRILLLDRDPSILELYRELLGDEGYETVSEEMATLCPDRVEQLSPNLIIMDYVLHANPGGLDFLQRLKLNERTAQIPVILCTAAIQMLRGVERYLKVDVLSKPFEITDLLAHVEQSLKPDEALTPLL
ncbi:MAG TPA: response regulator [Ardenticatenaceae bacterium]|jgi:CheY-like chemotaxis protein